MEALKDIRQFRDELLEIVNGQIAVRQYTLDELVGSLYPRILRAELEKLEVLKQDILKLGESE